MESWDERRPEQEGAAGTCHPLRGVFGVQDSSGWPHCYSAGAFWTPNGDRVNRAGDRTWARRREAMIP